jgi:hypothetical protein
MLKVAKSKDKRIDIKIVCKKEEPVGKKENLAGFDTHPHPVL